MNCLMKLFARFLLRTFVSWIRFTLFSLVRPFRFPLPTSLSIFIQNVHSIRLVFSIVSFVSASVISFDYTEAWKKFSKQREKTKKSSTVERSKSMYFIRVLYGFDYLYRKQKHNTVTM